MQIYWPALINKIPLKIYGCSQGHKKAFKSGGSQRLNRIGLYGKKLIPIKKLSTVVGGHGGHGPHAPPVGTSMGVAA